MMVHRKALIAAASVAAVLLAGAVAVGANVGILGGGDSDPIGELSAASVTTAAPRVIDVYDAGAGTAAQAGGEAGGQTFEVDTAGMVTLDSDGSRLMLASVSPQDGWSWRLVQDAEHSLRVELTNGDRTVTLHASRNADGSIAARVEELGAPAPAGASATAPESGGTRSGGDDGEYGEHEDEDHEDESHEYDDEAHEYEGHEDDD